MIIHDDCTQNLKISLQTFMNKIIVVLYISYIAIYVSSEELVSVFCCRPRPIIPNTLLTA